jgi:hypothetical protein
MNRPDASDRLTATMTCLDFYSSTGIVWEDQQLQLLGTQKLDLARQAAKDLVDGFILEWLKANPRK